jgi:lysophospholipase L1-like esterase
MKTLLAVLLTIVCAGAGTLIGQAPQPETAKKKKKPPAKKAAPRPAPVSPAARLAAREEIERRIARIEVGIENPGALASYFAALDQTVAAGNPVHILQFGDSHTASDDWVSTMRAAAQLRYGDGGPGFVQAGHPYRGYRRFDASGANSPGWKTDGTTSHSADPDQGLSHVSISTAAPGQTVHLSASGESLGIFYLKQPGGGQFELTCDGSVPTVVSTDGETGPGELFWSLPPGQHDVVLRTMHFAPVRLFGWTVDNSRGVTFETLGINGAQASVMLDADEQIWASEIARRAPALIVLAYGTNEANSRVWTAEQYRADLAEVIARIRRAAPNASILMVGPPDCGKLQPLAHLDEVIDIQREMAGRESVAFWDWRMHMGGARIVGRWVLAGLSQPDHIHLTPEGYRLLGNMLFDQLEKAHSFPKS